MRTLGGESPAGGQRGFTLIEMLMAIGAGAILMAAASYAILQVANTNTRNTLYMTAVRNAQSAGYWVSIDTEKANSVNADNNSATTDVLQLAWLDTDNLTETHSSNFTLEGSTLYRTIDGAGTMVAEHISNASATYDATAQQMAFVVTSEVSSRNITAKETRTYEISPRPEPGG